MTDLESFRYHLHQLEMDLVKKLVRELLIGANAHRADGQNPLEAHRSASGEVCAVLQRAIVEAGHRAAEASGANRWFEQQAIPSVYINPAKELHEAQDLIDRCYRSSEHNHRVSGDDDG